MAGPVSAFARRKAAQTGVNEVPVEAPIVVTAQVKDKLEASAPPKKRRRKANRSTPVVVIPVTPDDDVGYQDGSPSESSPGLEGSDSTDIEGDLEVDTSSTAIIAQRLSTVSKKSTILNDTDSELRVRLHHQDNLAIVGQYDLWIRSGAVGILGAVVHASSKLHRVYAPSTHAIPSIKPIANPYGTGNPPCEISILSCGSHVRMLKQIAPKFARIWNGREQAIGTRRSFANVQNSIDDPYKRPLQLLYPPPDWGTMVFKLAAKDHAAVMVCGPKGAGKSTFCRLLANAMHSTIPPWQQRPRSTQLTDHVVFLDLDPGQPEYSPPGQVSLHKIMSRNLGPPFSHPTSIGSNALVRAHYFGHISPKEDPHHYYECAVDLFDHYKKISRDHRSCSLIMNCPGWIQGSGLELLDAFIRDLELTDVVYMSTTGPKEVVDILSEATTTANTHLHQLNSHVPGVVTRTAADMRMMQTISYFHLGEPEGDNLTWEPSPLASQRPVIVRYADPNPDILATMILDDEQSPEFLESILDGSIVGVVVIDEDLALELNGTTVLHNTSSLEIVGDIGEVIPADGVMPVHWTSPANIDTAEYERVTEYPRLLRTTTGIPYLASLRNTTQPLRPGSSYCLGQALIRAIDQRNKTFHLLTPIPDATIQNILQESRRKIVLVRGKLDTPTWAYAEQFAFQKARRRRLEGALEDKNDYGFDGVRIWAEKQPWANVVDGGRAGSGKVRRVRRDIRYKSQNEGSVKD